MDTAYANVEEESGDGTCSFEFWVREPGPDGLGPVLERVRRRAIEQRLRQWSDKSLDRSALSSLR